MEKIKIDLHLHTSCSNDSIINVKKLPKVMKRKGIDKVAITDHNKICFNKIKKIKNWKELFIIGEEIKSKENIEIIGLFLNEEIKKGLEVEEIIDKIREQDGIVYLPHPYGFPRLKRMSYKLAKKVDVVEVFNSRNLFNWQNNLALQLAKKYNKIAACGSDSHSYIEIGNAINEIKPFNNKKEFLKNLKKAKFYCKKAFPLIHALSLALKIVNSL